MKSYKGDSRHIRRWIAFLLFSILLSGVSGLSGAVSLASAQTTNVQFVEIVKTFELQQQEKVVAFRIEGADGEFSSVLTIPGGHRIPSGRVNKIAASDGTLWTNEFTVRSAPKGVYTFTIKAPKASYYNLIADIPMFADIGTHWARDSITDFVQRGIVNGYGNGNFGPDDPVTGEAFIKMATVALTEEQPNGKRQWLREFRWRMLNEELVRELGWQEYSFTAATDEHWALPYLKAADDLGITALWEREQFAGEFKRKDIALLAANLISLLYDAEPNASTYKDTADLEAHYLLAIDVVSQYAIFDGYPDGIFGPEDNITRAQAVKVLSRLEQMLKS